MSMLSISDIGLIYVCDLIVEVRLEYIVTSMTESKFGGSMGCVEFV